MIKEGDVIWPGGATGPPPDTPFCGFENENPECQPIGKITIGLLRMWAKEYVTALP